jgi:formamidopyrimidine-DNA glycosylase
MSVELPEASILAGQLHEKLSEKRIASYDLRDYERMQKIGFINKDLRDYDRLVDGVVKSAVSRGNTIHIKLDNGMSLLIGPEYGGKVLYHAGPEDTMERYHLRVDFEDGTALTVRLTSMGIISAVDDDGLENSYLYRRDFSDKSSPIEPEFTFERFTELTSDRSRQLKQVLVGKEAVLVGLSNSAFQDVIYRAGLHPKRRASDLSEDERRALFDAINTLIGERLRLGGKDKFQDIYGEKGRYVPAMGPNMKGRDCPTCGTAIEKINHGGGQVYLCPVCQRE